MEATTSKDALKLAGLDWNVIQEPIYTEFKLTLIKISAYNIN